jgi:hypothetical protein
MLKLRYEVTTHLKKFGKLVLLQKMGATNEYLLNLNENFTLDTSNLAEQLYLTTKGRLTLTKVLKLRHEIENKF